MIAAPKCALDSHTCGIIDRRVNRFYRPDDKATNCPNCGNLAAVNGRTDLIELLVELGADLTARTRIDDYATPAEEVLILGMKDIHRFLKELEERQKQRE